ncbi:MAG: DNA translocase FtsK 4TM domain-containing protein [Desulfomonilaceae bacterium]
MSPPLRTHGSEFTAIIFFALSLFLMLCLISYDPRDPSLNVATTRLHVSNLCGLVGSYVADAMVQLLGVAALLIPLGLVVLALRVFVPPRVPLRGPEAITIFLLISGTSALLERFGIGPVLKFPMEHAGGAVGAFLHRASLKFLGSGGEIVLSLTIVLLCVLHLSKMSPKGAVRLGAKIVGASTKVLIWGWQNLKRLWIEHSRRGLDSLQQGSLGLADDLDDLDVLSQEIGRRVKRRVEEADMEVAPGSSLQRMASLSRLNGKSGRSDEASKAAAEVPGVERKKPRQDSETSAPVPFPWKSLQKGEKPVTVRAMELAIEQYLKDKLTAGDRKEAQVQTAKLPDSQPLRPLRVTRRADEDIPRAATKSDNNSTDGDYLLPGIDLLDQPATSGRTIDEKLLERNAIVLEQKLSDLGVQGKVVEIHPGPVITMYELSLASGVPLRKVLSTSDDLAMALKSGSTRVVAPIPGKATVGIEVPNLNREIVYFREIIESPAFMESSAPLKVALGKGIDGEPFATSLAKMPHLLIAGATGTGKSVGLNCLICSWLMSCNPDDLKFLMVDPKKLELSYYQDIPHLLHPVVTEAEKVPKVLSWAIREMERRYDLLSKAGAKNIEGYNQLVRSMEVPDDQTSPSAEKLPYIVIIVDELAELMMVAAKDIEISIARLAQMARAAGIHLILATQRPSVDVITGVIKANFPARLSFQVSAKPDSRTILDTVGAENLLGMGDMLFLPPGTAKLRRLHGAYVSEREIRKIVDFIKAQRAPVYLQEITKHVSEDDSKAAGSDLIDDVKYDEAVELVTRLGHASISLIQRHMRIGYNRAARIIEAMESEGLIGPSDGTSRPREVMARSLESIPDGG